MRINHLLLSSSSALVLLALAGVAMSQTSPTAPEGPQTTTTPETPPATASEATPPPPAEAPAPPPPRTTPESQAAPAITVPQVTVQAPQPRPARRTAPAVPGARSPLPLPPTAQPPTAAQPTTPSRFNPPFAPLTTITSNQIQASTSHELRQSVLHHARRHIRRACSGRGATGPARTCRLPGPRPGERRRHRRCLRSRPGPRGPDRSVDDPTNGDLPWPCGAALRVAGGRRHRRSHQQPHSHCCASGRHRSRVASRRDHRQQRVGKRTAARRRLAQCGDPRRRLRPPRRRLPHPELSLSLPARPRTGRERETAELVAALRGCRRRRLLPVRRRLCRHRDLPFRQRLSRPRPRGGGEPDPHQAGADQDHQQGRVPPAIRRHRRRPLLGRIHRLQARRDRTQRPSASSRSRPLSRTARARARSRSSPCR